MDFIHYLRVVPFPPWVEPSRPCIYITSCPLMLEGPGPSPQVKVKLYKKELGDKFSQ